jgi:hypothetical protein
MIYYKELDLPYADIVQEKSLRYIINNSMEYVYRLNLPSLLEVLKKDLIKYIDERPTPTCQVKPQDYFIDEIVQLKNLEWNRCSCFKKLKTRGPIHIDGYRDDGNNLIWGINWVHGAAGNMEYWDDWVDLKQKLTFDTAGLPRLDILPTTPATQVYPTVPGGVYLVNAGIPHLADNYTDVTRYAISMRAKDPGLIWEEVIDLFSDLII